MPRSGKKSHKGGGKQFSNPEEIDRQMRAQRKLENSTGAEKESSSEPEEESSSEDESQYKKRSAVEGLIEIENPNRVLNKSKKASDIDLDAAPVLSRREREEIEKQKSKDLLRKLQSEGKTEKGRADLARLAIIKKQREEAAKKREALRTAARASVGRRQNGSKSLELNGVEVMVSVGMLRQSLSILKQLGSAAKSQDATELLHEDLVLVEQRVEPAKKAAQHVHKKLQGCMQSQSGLEAEKRMKKLPLMLLSISMAESLKDFDAESSIRRVLEMCCFMEKMLANMLADFEMKVEKAVLEPLNKLSEEDLPEILRNKKQFARLTTDWNSAKTRSQTSTGHQAKQDGLREVEEAWRRLESIKDQYSADLYHFATKEQEYANYFIRFIELQAEYHKNSHEFLSKNISELKDNYLQKGPPVSFPSQRVYGEPLQLHLSQSSREIAAPVQECIHMLLRTGMREEGLFRLAAAASVVKRLKTCLDQGTVDHSEFSMDPHAVAGALKCYLRELPEPLMTFDLYSDWFKAAGEKELPEKLEQFRTLLQKLPAENYNNLRYLVQFLSLLSEQQAVNRMTPSNIAIVLGPNLLWPRAEGEMVSFDMASASSVQVVMVIEPLIQYSSSLFPEAVSFEMSDVPKVPDGPPSVLASQSQMSVKEKVGRTDSSSSSIASSSSCPPTPLSKRNSTASQDSAGFILVKSGSVSRSGTSTWASPEAQSAAASDSSSPSSTGTSSTSVANQDPRPLPKASGAVPNSAQVKSSALEPTLEEPPDSSSVTVITSSCKPKASNQAHQQLSVQYSKVRAPTVPKPRAPPPPSRAPGTADATKARPIPAPRGPAASLKKPPPKRPGIKAPNCPPPLPPPS